MNIRQYYYTSYVYSVTGKAGFQVKAMSAGIPSHLQARIAQLIAYSIPFDCDPWAIETHPVALRYAYEGPGESILLCSQSSGKDEHGRPGNFFAHALLLDEKVFTAPIFFWKSSLWRAHDPEEREQIASLPALSALETEVALDNDVIWRFLEQGNRRDWLYKLLCAIIHSSNGRRIVILDDVEHVALWIAAVTLLLPPIYRPLLTFATYHHDPYQVSYLITGTTPNSSFKASPEDYISYFVLNAHEGIVSSVVPSPYAKLATLAAYSRRYEEILLPLFSEYAHHFPTPTIIDEQIDMLFLYINAQYEMSQNEMTTKVGKPLSPSASKQVQCVFALLSKETYRYVIEACFTSSMRAEVSYATHLRLVQALFASSLRLELAQQFWQMYLDTLCVALQRPALLPRAIEMLNFWCTVSPSTLSSGYPVQQALLLISNRLRQEPELLRVVLSRATRQPWYASLQMISMRHYSPLRLFGLQVIDSWQRMGKKWMGARDTGYEPGETGEGCASEEEMKEFFFGGDVMRLHWRCANLYKSLSPSRFWLSYWHHFTQLLTLQDVERVFAILSFWFDLSYELLNPFPSLPREFFLGLGNALEQAMQRPQARSIVPLLHDRAQKGEGYPWYPLITPYLRW